MHPVHIFLRDEKREENWGSINDRKWNRPYCWRSATGCSLSCIRWAVHCWSWGLLCLLEVIAQLGHAVFAAYPRPGAGNRKPQLNSFFLSDEKGILLSREPLFEDHFSCL